MTCTNEETAITAKDAKGKAPPRYMSGSKLDRRVHATIFSVSMVAMVFEFIDPGHSRLVKGALLSKHPCTANCGAEPVEAAFTKRTSNKGVGERQVYRTAGLWKH